MTQQAMFPFGEVARHACTLQVAWQDNTSLAQSLPEVSPGLESSQCRGLPANSVMYNELLLAQTASRDCQGSWASVDEMLEACLEEIRLPALFC